MHSVLVVGAGATGGYFGARLLQAGRDVTFLVRPARADVLRRRGLHLYTPTGVHTLHPPLVVAGGAQRQVDVVLLAVGGAAVPQVLDDVAPAVGPQTAVVPVLNGMRHMAALTDRFGPAAAFGGVAKVVVTTTAQGDVDQLAEGASLVVGRQDGRVDQRVQSVVRLLDVPGYEVEASTDIVRAMWHKWVFIAAVGATTTLMDGTAGAIAGVVGGFEVARRVVDEAAAVSAAAGHPLGADDLEAIAAPFADVDSALTTSLYRDAVAGRPLEVEPVLGDLVRRAAEARVDVPLLHAATARLRLRQPRAGARSA